MVKKTYINPELQVENTDITQMLCSSLPDATLDPNEEMGLSDEFGAHEIEGIFGDEY